MCIMRVSAMLSHRSSTQPLLQCGRTILKDPEYGPVFGNVATHHAWLLMAWLLAATESLCDVTLRYVVCPHSTTFRLFVVVR
jgi:hypothetical protein